MKITHETHNMIQGASLWCHPEIKADFKGVKPTDNPRMFIFVFEVNATKAELDKWLEDYDNELVLVEPVALRTKWDKLKDRVTKQMGAQR